MYPSYVFNAEKNNGKLYFAIRLRQGFFLRFGNFLVLSLNNGGDYNIFY